MRITIRHFPDDFMNIGLISYFLQSLHRFRIRHGECAERERLGSK
ncbi:hypothetical protein BBCT_1153 [Bifidobacterium catenulatum DSM 16992 = JCM 1194 = LMG 11043]|uniref:Uncharacterized protein n=2 Tax=Bifidobacterium catenulatum DSM 16992 = JCM 1194 = LMG 11043 TaxID=566552 RepID=A0ABM7EVY4_9BIFI|nr:hypothetical protein BIFCAT_00514 [Bifidobacterium catenulatum DSM 16992 = JCM 1194 = LMG 11043]BAR02121.1 hypothetical protein BBCT_1153 [Bifidobacterium catenulatum DSM 16992 = JCM 1194 = LMG 11043]